MVAFLTTLLISVLLIAPIFPYAKRRPVGTPLTWGEAVVGATYVFFVMFWIYGVMPHHWLQWADSELNWRPDRIWFGPNGEITMPITGWSLQTTVVPDLRLGPGLPRHHRHDDLRRRSWAARSGCGPGGRTVASGLRRSRPSSRCRPTAVRS